MWSLWFTHNCRVEGQLSHGEDAQGEDNGHCCISTSDGNTLQWQTSVHPKLTLVDCPHSNLTKVNIVDLNNNWTSLSIDPKAESVGLCVSVSPCPLLEELHCSASQHDLCTWTLPKPLTGCQQETLQRSHTPLTATKSVQSTDRSTCSPCLYPTMTLMRSPTLIVPICCFLHSVQTDGRGADLARGCSTYGAWYRAMGRGSSPPLLVLVVWGGVNLGWWLLYFFSALQTEGSTADGSEDDCWEEGGDQKDQCK